jgi:hypothetical protein
MIMSNRVLQLLGETPVCCYHLEPYGKGVLLATSDGCGRRWTLGLMSF